MTFNLTRQKFDLSSTHELGLKMSVNVEIPLQLIYPSQEGKRTKNGGNVMYPTNGDSCIALRFQEDQRKIMNFDFRPVFGTWSGPIFQPEPAYFSTPRIILKAVLGHGKR